MSIRVTVIVHKEENWYVAKCIENSVASQGETIEESLIHLKEALALFYGETPLDADIEPTSNTWMLNTELDCIYSNNMLILTPAAHEDSAFAEEILADLIQQGYSGDALLTEFKNISRKVRPAVEKLIEETDKIAEAASTNYIDITDELFDDEETEE